VVLVLISSVKEIYAPVILKKRAAIKRKETQDTKWWTRYDDGVGFTSSLRINLKRPFVMLLTEPI
jgi:hypothetical protein